MRGGRLRQHVRCFYPQYGIERQFLIVVFEPVVEIQGAAEGATFSRETMDTLLATAEASIRQIFEAQRAAVEEG